MDSRGCNPGQRSSETPSFTSKLFLKYNLTFERTDLTCSCAIVNIKDLLHILVLEDWEDIRLDSLYNMKSLELGQEGVLLWSGVSQWSIRLLWPRGNIAVMVWEVGTAVPDTSLILHFMGLFNLNLLTTIYCITSNTK